MRVNPINAVAKYFFKKNPDASKAIAYSIVMTPTYNFLTETPDFITTFYTGEPDMPKSFQVYAHDSEKPIGTVSTTTEAKLMLIAHYKASHLLHNFSGISVKANTIFPLFSFDSIDLQA